MLRRFTLLSVLALSGVLFGVTPALASLTLQPAPINQAPLKPRATFLKSSLEEVEFGAVDVHGSGQRKAITFENSYPKPVQEKIRSVEIVGKGASSFQLVGNGCSGQILLRNPEGCTVEVSFQPGAPVARSATLEVVVEDVAEEEGEETEVLEEVEVPLSGEGITGTLSASPSPLEFSPIPYSGSSAGGEGEQSETKEVTIRADSKAGVRTGIVSISGPDAASFSVQNSGCENQVLEPENTCNESIRFQPRTVGPQHAQLEVPSDSGSSPLIVPLEGDGLLGPRIELNTSQALLGEVDLGSAVSQTFTLTNTGDYPLGVQQTALFSGTPLMFPIQSDTCSGKVIQAGAACSVTVSFQPTSTGAKSASILFITSSSLPLHVVGIEGVGVQPASPIVPPAPPAPPAPPVPSTGTSPEPAPPSQPPLLSPAPDLRGARWLSFVAPAFRYGPRRERSLDTGVDAICPPASAPCEVVSFIGASIPGPLAHGGSRRIAPTGVVLGASRFQLRGGTRARVLIHLSEETLKLLNKHRRLRTTVELAVRVRGTLVAVLTRSVTLVG